MADPNIPKVNSDTFSPPSIEDISVPSYESQVEDPFSLMREAARKRLYENDPSEIRERLVEVLQVNDKIKKPADLNYFSNFETAKLYGEVPFVCVIARVLDLDAGIPNPEIVIDLQTGKYDSTTVSKIRTHIGKFYAPTVDSKGGRIQNIEIGDLLLAEFLDKTNMTNGIIKKIYAKKGTASQTSSTGVGAAGTTSPSNPTGRPRQATNIPNNPTQLQEIWTLLALAFAEAGGSNQGMADFAQSVYNRYDLDIKFPGLYHDPKYNLSITSVLLKGGQYEVTFSAPEKWASIVDLNTAIDAVQTWRYSIGKSQNSQFIERSLKEAFDAIKNPTFKRSAQSWVGLRADFRANTTGDGSGEGEQKKERPDKPGGQPNSNSVNHNCYFVQKSTSRTAKTYILNNINNASPPPNSITPYLDPNAQWPPQ